MKTVFAYSPITKEFLGTTLAQESPLEKDVILTPANATLIEPPAVGATQKQIWNGSGWDIMSDFRGTVYYDADGNEYIMSMLGALPDGALLERPVVPEPIIQKTIFSKLAIRRACRVLLLENKLNALLDGNEMFRNDWTDAQDIDLADPVLVQALQAGAFTQAEIDSIKSSLQ